MRENKSLKCVGTCTTSDGLCAYVIRNTRRLLPRNHLHVALLLCTLHEFFFRMEFVKEFIEEY